MAAMKTMSIKIDEDLEQNLLKVATLTQETTGQKTTVSDVVRDLLMKGVSGDHDTKKSNSIAASIPYSPVGRKILLEMPWQQGGDTVESDPIIRARINSSFHPMTKEELEAKEREHVEFLFPEDDEKGYLKQYEKQKAINQISDHPMGSLMVPTFTLFANPTWHWSEGLENESSYIDEAMKSVAIKEDEEIFKLISNSVPPEHSLVAVPGSTIFVKVYKDQKIAEVRNFNDYTAAKKWILDLAISEGVDDSKREIFEEIDLDEEQINAWLLLGGIHNLHFEISWSESTSTMDISAALLWEHLVDVATVAYHPYRHNLVKEWRENQIGKKWPFSNSVEDVSFLSSIACPRDTIFLLGNPELVGRVVVKVDRMVIEANEPKRLIMGRMVWEDIGICIVNDYCLSKITIV